MSLVYEVHVATRSSRHREFIAWLESHMREVLESPGFIDASWSQPDAAFAPDLLPVGRHEEVWAVRYTVESGRHLKHYLKVHAPRLRAGGPQRFGEDLRILGRRVLKNGNSITKRGYAMKTDLNSLKKELGRLANLEYLKKELKRMAGEVKSFDVRIPLNAKAKSRLNKIEKRFRDVMKSIADVQKQVDDNVGSFLKTVRGSKSATARKSTAKRSASKPRKAAPRKARKTSKKRK